MKGAVFIALNQMIEEQAGMEAWESLLTAVNPGSQGIYTSVEDYPDEELFSLVTGLSQALDTPIEVLVESFGSYLFDVLNNKYPMFSEQQSHFFDFLESIDGVIHKEVRKLYESANLPTLNCKRLDDKHMEMIYHSPRKLCLLAEGLIRGAARYYQVDYQLEHDVCMHKGSDHCRFNISLQ